MLDLAFAWPLPAQETPLSRAAFCVRCGVRRFCARRCGTLWQSELWQRIVASVGPTSAAQRPEARAQSQEAGLHASPSASAPGAPEPRPVDEEARAHEARLLERCREGDLDAFDELVAQHQSKIFNLCSWMLGDRDEAGDAAQDAFVRAWRAIGNFRADAAFGTWMHRIAVNVCLDARAKRAKAPLTYSALERPDDEGESRTFDPADKADTPEQAVTRRERRQVVLEALAQLPEHHRAVLVLFDIQGYSYEDAAQVLELPMGTLKSRLNRARAALRKSLEGQRELFED
jgi:RNA polymerase sigma-70 factor (ECF subfamily)